MLLDMKGRKGVRDLVFSWFAFSAVWFYSGCVFMILNDISQDSSFDFLHDINKLGFAMVASFLLPFVWVVIGLHIIWKRIVNVQRSVK